ncbi:MAG: hypothetical protein Q8O67_30460 [Deltaproteobacteria bacterium]|nr:hypothetical protein [Deltaproteobacteria bacterium]
MEVVGLSYKARYAQNVLEELERTVPGPRHKRIIEGVDPKFLAHVRAATPVENVEGKHLLELFRAMRTELGDDGYVSWWRDFTLQLVRIPLLTGLLHGVVRVLGLTPHAVFKNLPRARGSLVRAGGTMTYERVDDVAARLTLSGYPRELMTSGIAGITMSGLYEGLLSFANAKGKATIDEENVAASRLVHTIRWIK